MVRTFTLPLYHKIMETKKTWEYVSRALIPILRPSHCPYLRISNVKPAHASDDICTHHGMNSQGNDNVNDNENDNENHYVYAKKVSPLLAYTLLYI